ncbi:MAG: hypothetical protein ACREWG_05695 [Gammaproteobacteria bacterium]
MNDPLSLLYRACNPNEALQPSDDRTVNCDAARHGGIAPILAKDFQRADPLQPIHRLFTGHIGVGKSTELHRLKALLDQPPHPQPRFEVIYFDVNEFLDPNDLKLADLLVLIAGRVHEHLAGGSIPGFTASNVALQRFWDHVKKFFGSSVELSEVSFDTGFATLALELKQGAASSREVLRKAINDQRTTLRKGVNDLLQTATRALQQSQRAAGLVVLVDGLEKLPADQHEDLFFEGCEQMSDLAAHTVYTVPMPLAYHPRFNTLTQAFGHQPLPVPMLHADTDEGMQCLRRLLDKRCQHAGLESTAVFDSEQTLQRLCLQTGGHLRHLMMFVQSALNKVDQLPVTAEAVESALRDYRHALARQVPGEFWPWLRCFRASPLAALPDELPDHVRRDLLHQLLVYEYANAEPRYDVNPVIRDLHNFTHGEPAGATKQP